ncbi:MAG TPA: Rieske 2Fe-2S domain-containing protein, partial [Fimbriimonadaceae bacterium]|nr:Rieske 2Fe-2S domain-containing protein [Fimbriimonadaceae bacterium]
MDYGIHPSVEQASTLPSRFYTGQEDFDRSLDSIFARSWQWVGDASLAKVPGQVSPITLLEGSLNEPLVLTRTMDDHVHCLSNVCTHRGNIICEGASNER